MPSGTSKITRRSFLAGTTLSVGSLATLSACASPHLAGTSPNEKEVPAEERKCINICNGACCNCPLEGTVRDGKLVSVSPIPQPRENTGAIKGCIKGQTNPMRLYAENRGLYPMIQRGERGSDNWERISWDEAIALVAEKFQAATNEYGPSSVAFWLGGGNLNGVINGNGAYDVNTPRNSYMGIGCERFLSQTGYTIFSFDWDLPLVYLGGEMMNHPYFWLQDLVNSKLIILWGINPAGSGGHFVPWYVKAKENGAKIISVDPQYNSSGMLIDQWVPIRPGTDSALMLAMANYIIDNDLVDQDYLANHSIAPFLLKEDGYYLKLSDLGKKLDIDEEGNEVDSPVVWDEKANDFISCLESTAGAVHGTHEANGVNMRTVFDAVYDNIKQFTVEYAAEECDIDATIIEELAREYATSGASCIQPGLGCGRYYNSSSLFYNLPLLAALTGNSSKPGAGYFGYGQALVSPFTGVVSQNLDSLYVEEPNFGRCISGQLIRDIAETGKYGNEDFPLRCVYVMTTNPVSTYAGPKEIESALNKIDFVVTADPIMTDTAKISDLYLPICMPWENPDDHNGTFMLQKAVEPAGECKSDFEVLNLIAEKMGFSDLYPKNDQEYLREVLDTPENIEAGAAYDDFKKQGIIPVETYEVAELTAVELNYGGRTRFYMEEDCRRDDYGQVTTFTDHSPFYFHANEAYPTNPKREKYPFFGFSFHDTYDQSSIYAHNPMLDEFREGPFVRMNTKAAAERGIQEDDVVRIYNDHGTCTIKVKLTEGIRPDCIQIPHGFARNEYIDGYPQDLSTIAINPVVPESAVHDWICNVEKVEEGDQ